MSVSGNGRDAEVSSSAVVEERKQELLAALVGVSRGADAGLDKRAIIEEAQVSRTKDQRSGLCGIR